MNITTDDSGDGSDLKFAVLMIAISVLIFLVIRRSERSRGTQVEPTVMVESRSGSDGDKQSD